MYLLDIFGLCFSLVVLIAIAIGIVLTIKDERKQWNKGICKECKTNWKQFDTASDGSRGYVCSCGSYHFCWISYNIDKTK